MPGEVSYDKTTISRSRGANALDSLTPKERAAVLRKAPSASVAGAEYDKTTISRSRGTAALDSLSAKERAAVLRRSPSASIPGPGTVPQRPVVRSERVVNQVVDAPPPRVAATRSSRLGGGDAGSPAPTTIGMSRGVSLQSLQICSSPGLQEKDTKDILDIVGSRESCRDEKGEFHFKGTRRISSFNLILIPSPGRKPSNRCEELENAYNCLKTH
jgi:hypothetical protein